MINIDIKHAFFIPVISSVLLLAGCAGVSGDFECNATTSDRCMTMDQANQKARQQTGDVKGKPAAAALPALVNLPSQAANRAPATSYALPSHPLVVSRLTSPGVTTPAPAVTRTPIPMAVSACLTGHCDSPGQTRVQRSAEQVAHVWVAPWVDTDDVFHQPGRVSFVMDAAYWQMPQSVN